MILIKMTMKTIQKIVIRILRNSRNNLRMIKMILRIMLTRIILVESIMKRILIKMTLVEITKIILKMIIELRGFYKAQMVITGILTERGLSGFAFRHACTATLYDLYGTIKFYRFIFGICSRVRVRASI